MQRHQSSISIGYWNVNKLNSKQVDKTKDDIFLESLNKNDIIGLAEVQCDMSECGFEDFFLHCVERKSCKA